MVEYQEILDPEKNAAREFRAFFRGKPDFLEVADVLVGKITDEAAAEPLKGLWIRDADALELGVNHVEEMDAADGSFRAAFRDRDRPRPQLLIDRDRVDAEERITSDPLALFRRFEQKGLPGVLRF